MINVGDFLGHLPLPAKITVQVLEPIDLDEDFGRDPDVDEVYEHVTGDAGHARRARGRAPPARDRRPVRIEETIEVAAPRALVWDYVTDPANYLEFMEGVTRWEVARRRSRPRPRRPATGC